MADNPFDRTIINLRERPLSTDINQAQSQIDRAMRFAFERMLASRVSATSHLSVSQPAFVGDGFVVSPTNPASMQVTVRKGLGWLPVADTPAAIGGIVGLDDLCSFKPIVLMADTAFAVPVAPGAPNTRIDIIEVKLDRRAENPLARDVLNATTGVFDPTVVNKTLAYYLDGRTGVVTDPAPSTAGLSYKIGVAANPGLAPGVTAGYVKIAEIRVSSGVASIADGYIVDRRQIAAPGNVLPVGATFFVDYNGGAPFVTAMDINAPPGVVIGAKPGVVGRGAMELYIAGGEILGCQVTHTLQAPAAASQAVLSWMISSAVMSATGTEQAAGLVCDPVMKLALTQKVFKANFTARFIDKDVIIPGGPWPVALEVDMNFTDSKLDQVTYHIHALMRY